MGVRRLPGLRKEDNRTLFPQTGGISEIKTRSIDDTQDLKHIGRQVEKQNGFEPIGARCLLCLEVGHRLAYSVLIDDVQKMFHNDSGGGRGVVVVWKMKRCGLREVGTEEEVSSLLAQAGGSTVRLSKRREVVDVLAVEHMHKAASFMWSRCPLHMGSPGPSPATLPEIASLGGAETGVGRCRAW